MAIYYWCKDHLNLSSGYFHSYHLWNHLSFPPRPQWHLIPAVRHCYHTHTHKHKDYTQHPVGAEPVGACLMLTQWNVCMSLQCSPLTLRARCKRVPQSPTHIYTQHTLWIHRYPAVLLSVLSPTQHLCLAVCRPVGLHACFVCVCACSHADSGFSLSSPPLKALQIQSPWKPGGGKREDDVDFLTPSVPWDTNCQQLHMFVCLCACVCIRMHIFSRVINMIRGVPHHIVRCNISVIFRVIKGFMWR